MRSFYDDVFHLQVLLSLNHARLYISLYLHVNLFYLEVVNCMVTWTLAKKEEGECKRILTYCLIDQLP